MIPLSSWSVGWMKWCKHLMFAFRKTKKYTLPFIFWLKCLLFSLPIRISRISPIFRIFLVASAYVWLPGKSFFISDVTSTWFDMVSRNRNFWSTTMMLLFLSCRYYIIRVYFFLITIFCFTNVFYCFFSKGKNLLLVWIC